MEKIMKQDKRVMKDKEIFLRAIKYIKPYKKYFFLAFILLALTVFFDISLPLIISDSTKNYLKAL